MKRKIFDLLLKTISKIINKKIIYINKNYIDHNNLAVKSKYGFWYCGNVFEQSDIAYGVASDGLVEREDSELVVKILESIKKDFIFFDIGANTGWYSMLAAQTNKNSRIVSFEPIKEHLESLTQTIFLNKLENRVTVSDFAISDTEGRAKILLAGTGSSLEKSFLEEKEGARDIKITTLDSYVENNKIGSPDFIKIDIEGHEYKALIGAKKTISTSLPILFTEIAYTLKNINRKFINTNYKETFSLLDSFGYQTYIVKKNAVEKYNPEQKIDGIQMYLFLHQNKHKELINTLGLN